MAPEPEPSTPEDEAARTSTRTLIVPRQLQRSRTKDEERAVASARAILSAMARALGYEDLSGLEVLDVGCGVKFSQVLVNDALPIGRYVGVDAYEPVVSFLAEHVKDPRCSYHHANFHNERYNPTGVEISGSSRLPIEDRDFDIICLFSVFTHLNPRDYRSMLELLRPYVASDGHLFFTVFIDELTSTGHGLIDRYAAKMGPGVVGRTVDYRDFTPDDPLRQTLYTESYARALIDGSGWEVVELLAPTEHMQHQFILRPV